MDIQKQQRENMVRATIGDLKKAIKTRIFALEMKIATSEDGMMNRKLWERVNGLKISIEEIDTYEKEIVDLMYPR